MHLALLALSFLGCSDYELVLYDGTDVFYQDPASEVDILLVIDDSGSMQPYQDKLSTNFEQFISYFTDANIGYQIGVVTTDVVKAQAGTLVGQVVTPDTPNGAEIFKDIVQVGTSGSASEMGLEAAYLALSGSKNPGFLRDDASLSIIFVSDEEDSSPLPVYEYIRAFEDIKGARSRDVFNASSLIVTDPNGCDAYSTKGDRYIDMASETDGVIGNICANDFADIVTELSLNASRLQDTFYLSAEPDVSTLEVSIDDTAVDCSEGTWTFTHVDEQPAVVFDRSNMPPPNAQIAIRYYYGAGNEDEFCSGEGSSTDDTGGAQ
ncbi:MAG: vWA domain-containing protein [Myxococcota bacterium]|nr:vWA domain-containing protein [Myxococcota bacterium]